MKKIDQSIRKHKNVLKNKLNSTYIDFNILEIKPYLTKEFKKLTL